MTRAISVKKETAYGTWTSPDGSDSGIKVKEVSDPVNRNPYFDETIDSPMIADAVPGDLTLQGTLSGPLRFNQMLPLFNSLLGDPTAGVYSMDSEMKSLSMAIDDDSISGTSDYGDRLKYTGVIINSLGLTFSPGQPVMTQWGYIASEIEKAASPSSVSYVTDSIAMCYAIEIKFGRGSQTRSIKMKNASLQIKRAVDPQYRTIGSAFLRGISMNGVDEISGSLTFSSKEWDEYQRAIFGDNGESPYTIKTTVGTEDETYGTTTEMYNGQTHLVINVVDNSGTIVCVFDIPIAIYTDASRSISGRNVIDKTMNWRAVGTNSDMFTLTDPVS